MNEIEILSKMHNGRGRWFEMRPPFVGCYKARPFVTNGHMMLIDDRRDALVGAAESPVHKSIDGFMAAKHDDDPRVRFHFSGVPDNAPICVACRGTGDHWGCCLDGICECAATVCSTCHGDGIVYPIGIWTVELADGSIIDAYYLRLALGFLQTDSPTFSREKLGTFNPVILSFLGRDAVLMPMSAHARDGASQIPVTVTEQAP